MRKFLGGIALLGMAACGGHDTTAPATPKTVDVLNYLNVPVTITVDGVSYGSVNGGTIGGPATVALVLSPSASRLAYAVGRRMYSDGSLIPSDLSGETIALTSTAATLGITNIVQGVPYFTFSVVNRSGGTIEICLARDGQTIDLGNIGYSATSIVAFFYGYYTLTPTTELREYVAGGCTGAYLVWNNATLAGYAANSGSISLVANQAP